MQKEYSKPYREIGAASAVLKKAVCTIALLLKMFDLFQFTEKTTRLRRNLLVFALLCFCVGFFNVSVESIPLGGNAIRLPPKAFEFALASMLIYHFITFYWAALDEYKHWRLAVTDKIQILADGGPPKKSSFLLLIYQNISNIESYDRYTDTLKKDMSYLNKMIKNKEINNNMPILSDHLSRIEDCSNDIKKIMEKIENIELIIEDFVKKFKKYRTFTIIRVCFIELAIPFIATLIALVWGVMQFQYLWVD